MNYIKKHKLTSLIIFIYIILIVFAYFIYKLLVGNSGLPQYGNRLEGIEKYPITEEQQNKIVEDISKENYVLEVKKPYLSGRILKVIITISDLAPRDIKYLADLASAALTKEQNDLYDIEVYINKEYNCWFTATGRLDENGTFIEPITIQFSTNLSENKFIESYGISLSSTPDFNGKQTIEIKDDGEYIVYGFTKDKFGDYNCQIKIVKKDQDIVAEKQTITTNATSSFPIIGYKTKGIDGFVWTKNR